MSGYSRYSFESDEGGGAWPALADLLAATTLIFLVLFAVIAVPALRKLHEAGQVASTLKQLKSHIDRDSSFTVQRVGDYLRITIGGDVVFPQARYALADMNPIGQARLDSLARVLKDTAVMNRIDQVQVVGHTSSEGSDATNWALSSNRAVTVAQRLIANGLPVCKVTALGRGRYYPINPDSARLNPTPKAADRRIEIELRPIVKNDPSQERRRANCVERPGSAAPL